MKKYPKSLKFISQKEALQLYTRFIKDSYKGHRVMRNGERVKRQTVDNYQYVYKLLCSFLEETSFEWRLYLVDHLSATESKKAGKYWLDFQKAFSDYMYDQKGYYDNYVGSVFKNLKVFFNYLKDELHLNVGQFHKKFFVPKEDIPIVVLTPEQLNYLIYTKSLDKTLNEDLRMIKDVFVFGCTVALRVSDLMQLQKHNVVEFNGVVYLEVVSLKTDTKTKIRLPDYAVSILGKYKRTSTKYLFPRFTVGHFNRKLKELATHLDTSMVLRKTRQKRGRPVEVYKDPKKKEPFTLADHITTHTMRRTAITTMLGLGMNEQLVRKISGHASNSSEFYKYVAYTQSLLDQETAKAFAKLAEIR